MRKVLFILILLFIGSLSVGCNERKPVKTIPDNYAETIQKEDYGQSKPKIETVLFETEEGTYRIFTAVKANSVSIHVVRADK